MSTIIASLLRSQISWLEGAVSHQTAVLMEMHNRLRLLRQQLTQVAVFPVNNLPPEILSEIFVYCLEALTPVESVPSFNAKRPTAPLLLTQICRTWRNIALSTPKLWRCLSVCINPHLHATRVLETWAARARACPLDVALYDVNNGSIGPPPSHQFIDSFRRQSNRIRRLTLELGPPDMVLLNAESFDLSNLEILELDFDNQSAGRITMFRAAPHLRSLYLRDIFPSDVDLAWSRLTELRLDALGLHTCIEALRLAPNVTHAELHLACQCNDLQPGHTRQDLLDTPVIHRRLQHLELYEAEICRTDESEQHALRFLALPALQTLELGWDDDLLADDMALFLRNSSAPLEKLTLRSWTGEGQRHWMSMDPFIGFGLAELELENPSKSFTNHFFTALSSNMAFLPSLRAFSFTFPAETYFSGLEHLIDRAGSAISQRLALQRPCSLRSVRLVYRGHRESPFNFSVERNLRSVNLLRSLQQAGINIYIGTATQRIV
ncbi:hypothetical protein C8F01DRAFT_1119273 [Mycena amicta]|nr:hypothetical protein C8F01DRAFT_1119273 [Mycena amicta]